MSWDKRPPERCPIWTCRKPLTEESRRDYLDTGYPSCLLEEEVYKVCPVHGRVYCVTSWAHGADEPGTPGYMVGWRTWPGRLWNRFDIWWHLKFLRWLRRKKGGLRSW